MRITSVLTDKAPAAIGPYSQAVIANSLVFVSGQLGLVPETGEMAGHDLASQAAQCLKNISSILLASGSSFDNVLAVDVFLTDMGNFSIFNGIYQDFFSDHRPARAVVEVSALPKGALVEIKCTALSSG